MSLTLGKKDNYANPYRTNWDYLRNMTSLQMKSIEEITWDENYKYIHTNLWSVPWNSFSKGDAEHSVNYFIEYLNEELKRL